MEIRNARTSTCWYCIGLVEVLLIITNFSIVSFNYNGGGQIAEITTNGSSVSYGTGSDYRLKENITTLTNAITRLKNLKPSRFNFLKTPSITQDGFIAHEVQEVVPEAVTGVKDEVLTEDGDMGDKKRRSSYAKLRCCKNCSLAYCCITGSYR